MNSSKKEKALFRILLNRSLDGEATLQEIQQMNSLFSTYSDIKEYYLTLMRMQSMLHEVQIERAPSLSENTILDEQFWANMAEYEKTAPEIKVSQEQHQRELIQKIVYPQQEKRKFSKFSISFLIMNVAALLFVILYVKLLPFNSRPAIAKLTRTVNAQWQDASGQITPGCDLYAGPVKLLRGLAEVRFDNGAKLIMEGPAEVELESLEQIYLGSGSIVVNVSASEVDHFAVRSDNCSIVDYGTEFGASVSADGQVRVDVFEGSVSLRDSFNPLSFNKSLLLEKGERGEVNRGGQLTKTTFYTSRFVREDEFDINIIAVNNSYYRWKAYNYQLHKDPDLVAHYTFEINRDRSDALINSAPATRNHLDGILSGSSSELLPEDHRPEWSKGRWPNKTALSFKSNNDSMVVIPANDALQLTGSITLCAWVNFSGENAGGAIIDCREEYNINFHLYLHREENMEVMEFRRYSATKLEDQSWAVDFNIPKKTWCMVSVTHDNHVIRYYLDGNLIGEVPHEYQAPQAAHGELIIGNALFPWASPFKNEIGEIVILKRAMTLDEIHQMYLAGRSR